MSTFFQDNMMGFILDRYKDLDDQWQKVALFRNLGWQVDLAEEHKAALANVEIASTPENEYEALPSCYTEHDEAIQARLGFMREGVNLGFAIALSSVRALAAMTAGLSGDQRVEIGARMKPILLAKFTEEVFKLGEEVGLPEFMAGSLDYSYKRIIEEHVNVAFGLELLESETETGNTTEGNEDVSSDATGAEHVEHTGDEGPELSLAEPPVLPEGLGGSGGVPDASR